jgi:signal transduction histidine kinase
MQRARSITVRLSLVFLFLLLLVVVLGALGTASLSYFNGVSSQVRTRWLPSTRVLGDLNNLTSDFRAAEAASLLVTDAGSLLASEREMQELDRGIAVAQRGYEQIPHDAKELAQYAKFTADWQQYREIVRRIRSLTDGGNRSAAVFLYNTTSKHAYDAASDALGSLTDRNVMSAQRASMLERAAYARALWLIVSTIVLAGVLVAAALVHVRRSISTPLLALAERMRRIAVNETSTVIEGTERQDEIGEMARAVVVFRDNAIELMRSRHGLEQQARMLKERLAEEQRLMLLQRNFVSMASHEFRTPLTIIDAHAQRMIRARDRLAAEDLIERAGKIRSAVARMTHLISNLIDCSRALDGDVRLYFHPGPMDVAQLLREVCQLQREIVPQAQIREALLEQPLPIVGDPNLLFQVFCNLLSNAIKYSPRGGLITVSAGCDAASVAVSVEDHGIGIKPVDRAHIFERYYRGSNAAGIVGTGVGLYFVRMVVELHGGEVDLESEEGSGSRFTVRLPPASARPGHDASTTAPTTPADCVTPS